MNIKKSLERACKKSCNFSENFLPNILSSIPRISTTDVIYASNMDENRFSFQFQRQQTLNWLNHFELIRADVENQGKLNF